MAVVNVYRNGEGIVINEAKLQKYLADGYISEAACKDICNEKAANAYQAWLNNPETVAERFQSLRSARDMKIGQTDYLMTADYPLSEEKRAAVVSYRQALRDLPAQTGAPWDGGGALTPWPEMPAGVI